MSKQLLEFFGAHVAAQQELNSAQTLVLQGLLEGSVTGATRIKLRALLQAAKDNFEARVQLIQLPHPSGWTDEKRLKLGASISRAWADKQADMKLFFFEWSNQPPTRLSYEEASAKLGLAPATLRVRISKAPTKSFTIYRGGRHYVLAKTEDGLEGALNARFVQTGDPDQIVILPRQAKMLQAQA